MITQPLPAKDVKPGDFVYQGVLYRLLADGKVLEFPRETSANGLSGFVASQADQTPFDPNLTLKHTAGFTKTGEKVQLWKGYFSDVYRDKHGTRLTFFKEPLVGGGETVWLDGYFIRYKAPKERLLGSNTETGGAIAFGYYNAKGDLVFKLSRRANAQTGVTQDVIVKAVGGKVTIPAVPGVSPLNNAGAIPKQVVPVEKWSYAIGPAPDFWLFPTDPLTGKVRKEPIKDWRDRPDKGGMLGAVLQAAAIGGITFGVGSALGIWSSLGSSIGSNFGQNVAGSASTSGGSVAGQAALPLTSIPDSSVTPLVVSPVASGVAASGASAGVLTAANVATAAKVVSGATAAIGGYYQFKNQTEAAKIKAEASGSNTYQDPNGNIYDTATGQLLVGSKTPVIGSWLEQNKPLVFGGLGLIALLALKG